MDVSAMAWNGFLREDPDLPKTLATAWEAAQLWFVETLHLKANDLEEVMDYRTFCCAIAALVQKPSRDFPLKQGREQSPEIDIPSW